jgi:hypothetical protein
MIMMTHWHRIRVTAGVAEPELCIAVTVTLTTGTIAQLRVRVSPSHEPVLPVASHVTVTVGGGAAAHRDWQRPSLGPGRAERPPSRTRSLSPAASGCKLLRQPEGHPPRPLRSSRRPRRPANAPEPGFGGSLAFRAGRAAAGGRPAAG